MAKRNVVSLGGVKYFVRGPVIAQPVSDFAANVRIGEPSYETRQGAGYAVFEDWSGGPGIMDGLTRQDLARYSLNRGVDTRIPRQATLPLAAEAATDAPNPATSSQSSEDLLHVRRTNRAMQHFRSSPLTAASVYDILFYGDGIHWNKPSDWGLDWTTVDSTLDCILDGCLYTPPQGSYAGDEWIITVGKSGWRRMDTGGISSTEVTVEVPSTTHDGHLTKIHASDYTDCRAAAATADDNDTTFNVGQQEVAGAFGIYRVYLRMTNSIPTNAVIASAKLKVWLLTDQADTDFTLQVRKYAWTPSLAAGDWRATPSNDPLMGSIATDDAAWPSTGAYVEIDLDPTLIEKSDYTGMYLISSRDDDDPGTEPSGLELVVLESEDHADDHAPRLVIEYYTVPTELHDKEIITCLPWGDKLLLQVGASAGLGTSAGDIVVSLDADTVVKDSGGSDADVIWSLPYGNFLGPAAAPWGEMAPYFITDTDLYVLDFWGRAAYKVPVGLQYIKCACTWSDGLVISDGYNIKQVIPGTPYNVRHIGLGKEQGFLSLAGWQVGCLWAVDGGNLYALLEFRVGAFRYTWLWEYSGAAWHPLGKWQGGAADEGYGIGLMVTDKQLGGATISPQRGYWFVASDMVAYPSEVVEAYRITEPEDDPNPLIGANAAFETGGHYLETPWLDGGFRELKGAALQMWFGGIADTDDTVAVRYAIDGSSSFTSLGTFNGTQTHINFGAQDDSLGTYAGVEFRTIMFRFTLTGTASSTPNALPMTFVFRKKPGLRMSYLINIDCAREFEACAADGSSKEFNTVLAALKALWNTKTLIRFFYPAETEAGGAVAEGSRETDTRLDIVSMPTRETEIRDAVIKGVITVQLAEPVDF